MNPYEKYESSGIDWIGNIPSHWEIKPIKYLIKKGKEGIRIGPFGSSLRSEFLSLNGLKVYGQENIINDDFELGWRFINDEKFNELSDYEIKAGDILVTMMGTTGKCKVVPTDFQKGIMDSHLIRIRIDEKQFLPRLCADLINSSYYLFCQMKMMSKGSIMEGLNSSIVKNLFLLIPPIEEQRAISNFLDEKTSQIDKLISNKQKLIELLKEERTAIINDAVSGKGKNWVRKKLRYLCKITTGARNTEDRIEDGEYPFYVRSQTVEKINSFSFDGEGILTAGDGVGVAKVFHYVNGKIDFHQRVYLFYDFANEISAKYLFHFIQMNLIYEVQKHNAKSTVDSLRLPMLKDFSITFPPSKIEQNTIVETIKTETERIDKIISKTEKEIELMNEYRTALISEAVTGKIKVA